MTDMTQQQLMRRRFSDAAREYGRASSIQAAVARELAKELELKRGMRVLDVGAGDGLLARLAIAAGARVTALDLAWGMVRKGASGFRRGAWVQGHACSLPFAPASFDRVVSSSSYQWVDDLKGAFGEARRVLVPGGRFQAALFGRRTLNEFFESLACAASASRRSLPRLRRLPSMAEVSAALKAAGLKDPTVRVEERKVVYQDVRSILTWLKAIGANGAAPGFFWGKRLLLDMEKEYISRCGNKGSVHAWFEVIWIEAKV